MGMGNFLAQTQTQAIAFGYLALIAWVIQMPVKALKHPIVQSFHRQVGGVGQRKLHNTCKNFGLELNAALGRGVLDGIADQIAQKLLKQTGVG
jgi:hypothetical protein